jgi:hypothetical protein
VPAHQIALQEMVEAIEGLAATTLACSMRIGVLQTSLQGCCAAPCVSEERQKVTLSRRHRLDRVYLLEIDPTCPHVSIDQINGAEAVRALIDQTYHFNFILDSGRVRDHLALCAYLASKITVYRLRRSPSVRAGIELGSIICAHLSENQPENPIEPECDARYYQRPK